MPGDIVDQLAVPILDDDDAREVFDKVTAAAEIVLARSLPVLARRHRAPRVPQAIEPGQYFGRRGPEDGRIDWQRPAQEIHNLVRAVAPPFPRRVHDSERASAGSSTAPVSQREQSQPSERARLFGERWQVLRGMP